MGKTDRIGTLLRCADITEERIARYRGFGLGAIQIAGVYETWLGPDEAARHASDALFALLRKYDIAVPSLFLSYPDQDWAHPREGIGLVPEATRAARLVLSCRQMNWAKRYGIPVIVCHAGFVPETPDDSWARLVGDLKQLARFAAANGQEFLFETGTDSAAALQRTIDAIDEPNVGVNFDPANLLIYGTDTPAAMVELLAERIRGIHCKDAVPALPGAARGRETVLGKGATEFADLFRQLLAKGFSGPIVIERELKLGPEQENDIAEAVKFIRSLLGENGFTRNDKEAGTC